MAEAISAEYRAMAEEFVKRVTFRLGNKIDSILLYGSVSRGEAKKSSDIDLFIVTPYAHNPVFKDAIYTIATDFELENDFSFLISMFFITLKELAAQVLLKVPFIDNVKTDGVKLYGKWVFGETD